MNRECCASYQGLHDSVRRGADLRLEAGCCCCACVPWRLYGGFSVQSGRQQDSRWAARPLVGVLLLDGGGQRWEADIAAADRARLASLAWGRVAWLSGVGLESLGHFLAGDRHVPWPDEPCACGCVCVRTCALVRACGVRMLEREPLRMSSLKVLPH